MIITCGTYGYNHIDWPDVLDKMAEHGWKNIEIAALVDFCCHVNTNTSDPGAVREEIEARGLRIRAFHVGILCGTNKDLSDEQIAYIQATIPFAQELGVDQIVFTGGPRDSERIEDLIAPLESIGEALNGTSVRIGLENHPNNRIETIEDYDYIFSRIDHPQIGITGDIGLFYLSKVDTDALFRKYAAKIYHVHVKDYVGQEVKPLGGGEVDVAARLRTLKSINYSRALSVEIETKDLALREQWNAEAVTYMDRVLKEIGAV